jgi:recombination protein RecR
MQLAAPLERLIERLRALPGVGQKSAQRLAFHILRSPDTEVRALAAAIVEVKERIRLCAVCFNITDVDPCLVCADASRDRTAICVVASGGCITSCTARSRRSRGSAPTISRSRRCSSACVTAS